MTKTEVSPANVLMARYLWVASLVMSSRFCDSAMERETNTRPVNAATPPQP
ncbi:MAG TPA: hypothetical protein VIY26_09555 [Acidimicrobiales bacterium]